MYLHGFKFYCLTYEIDFKLATKHIFFFTLEYGFCKNSTLYCKVPQIEEKKCSTGQRFIRKEVISYKIHTKIVTPFILVESDSEGNPVVRIVPKEPVAKSGSSSSSSSSSSDTESLDNADTNSRNDQILCQTSLGETISDSLSKAVVVEVPKPLPETPTPEATTATVDKSSSEDESHQQETEMNISPEVSEPIIVVQAESENFREKAESISSKKSSSSSSSESERYPS